MSYASFTNLPASAKFRAHSVDGGRAVPACVGRGRLAAALVLAAATEFLRRSRCGLFRSRPLSSGVSAAVAGPRQVHSGIPSDFHIGVARFHRAPAIFPDFDATPPGVPMERRQRRLPRILLLPLDDIPSENLGRLLARTVLVQAGSVVLAVLCTRTILFSLLQPAIASGLIDARRVILIGDQDHCLQFSARAMATGIRTIRSFDFPTVRAHPSVHAGAVRDPA